MKDYVIRYSYKWSSYNTPIKEMVIRAESKEHARQIFCNKEDMKYWEIMEVIG